MLTAQLRDLGEKGLVIRKAYAEVPPQVEYSLTDLRKIRIPFGMPCGNGANTIHLKTDKKMTGRPFSRPSRHLFHRKQQKLLPGVPDINAIGNTGFVQTAGVPRPRRFTAPPAAALGLDEPHPVRNCSCPPARQCPAGFCSTRARSVVKSA